MIIVNGLCIITITMITQIFMLIQYFRNSSNDDKLKSRKADLKQTKSHKTSVVATFFHNTTLIMCFGPLFVSKFFELIRVIGNFRNKNKKWRR